MHVFKPGSFWTRERLIAGITALVGEPSYEAHSISAGKPYTAWSGDHFFIALTQYANEWHVSANFAEPQWYIINTLDHWETYQTTTLETP